VAYLVIRQNINCFLIEFSIFCNSQKYLEHGHRECNDAISYSDGGDSFIPFGMTVFMIVFKLVLTSTEFSVFIHPLTHDEQTFRILPNMDSANSFCFISYYYFYGFQGKAAGCSV